MSEPPTASGDAPLEGVLAAFVDQARAMATRLAGDPEQLTLCHFCNGPLPLWENLLVVQLTGVAAHVECPPRLLRERLRAVGPGREFPYDEFSRAVEDRMAQPPVTYARGEIVP